MTGEATERNFWGKLFELVGIIGPAAKKDDPKRTARLIRLLLFIAVLTALAVAALLFGKNGIALKSFVWGLIAATCALLAGGTMGILFGLPTRDTIRQASGPTLPVNIVAGEATAQNNAVTKELKAGQTNATADITIQSDPRDKPGTGYVESTSLEQVADWLTKIIIGLTLTQYSDWEQKYFELSRSVTMAMQLPTMGCDIAMVASERAKALADCAAAQAIPGGMLMAIFALVGFIVAYFWMRRYFIFEMVTARDEERKQYWAKSERARIVADPVAQANEEARKAVVEAKANTDAEAAAAKAKVDAESAIAIARAEADAAAARAQVEADAAMARAQAEADAAIALAQAEAAAAAAVASANAAAQQALASQESQLKANVSISEPSPRRNAETGENLQQIIKSALDTAPKIEVVQSSLNTVLESINNNPITYPDDPWRERVSANSAENGYTLSAVVTATETPTLFNVKLNVHTDHVERDRGATVRFLLHPTFGPDPRVAAFDANGDAILDLIAYGAFTVGAITETGTLLELNLATIETSPETVGFLQR